MRGAGRIAHSLDGQFELRHFPAQSSDGVVRGITNRGPNSTARHGSARGPFIRLIPTPGPGRLDPSEIEKTKRIFFPV